jgi:hypothetical protein
MAIVEIEIRTVIVPKKVRAFLMPRYSFAYFKLYRVAMAHK